MCKKIYDMFMMNGLFLITHWGIGQAFLQTLEHIMGNIPPEIALLELNKTDIPQNLEQIAKEKLRSLQTDGVLILTDIFGASPANLALLLLNEKNVEMLSGLNLAMLLRAVNYRHLELPQMLEKAQNGAQDSVLNVRCFLSKGN